MNKPFSKVALGDLIWLRLCIIDMMHSFCYRFMDAKRHEELRLLLAEIDKESDLRYKRLWAAMDKKKKVKK